MSMQDYKIICPLGKGAFAAVSKVHHLVVCGCLHRRACRCCPPLVSLTPLFPQKVERKSDGKVYALKRVNISKMSKREVADAVNEIRVLASVRHPHIVSFLQAFLDKGDKELCIIMEYCG
jgi:serine/threonine protein kinase